MEVFQYSAFIADYESSQGSNTIMRLERIATKKKAHMIIEAHYEKSDADCLIAMRVIDWFSLSEVPSFYVPSQLLRFKFGLLGFRLDFIP